MRLISNTYYVLLPLNANDASESICSPRSSVKSVSHKHNKPCKTLNTVKYFQIVLPLNRYEDAISVESIFDLRFLQYCTQNSSEIFKHHILLEQNYVTLCLTYRGLNWTQIASFMCFLRNKCFLMTTYNCISMPQAFSNRSLSTTIWEICKSGECYPSRWDTDNLRITTLCYWYLFTKFIQLLGSSLLNRNCI